MTVRYLDAAFLDALETRFMLTDVTFRVLRSEAGSEMSLAGDIDGLLGFLNWQPRRPGSQAVVDALPGIASTCILIVSLVIFLVAKLRRTARELHDSNQQALHLAHHDVLTDLPNRALFDQRLAAARQSACRTDGAIAVHYCDLDGFIDQILATLAEAHLEPERLQIEITEELLLDASPSVSGALTALRHAGVQIALDDFGTGYSSLKYLSRYRVDKIKIDRSFVQNLGMDPGSQAIVKAVLELARALGLSVVAEGVETDTQWHMIRALGAPEIQGFRFATPLDTDALGRLAAAMPAPDRTVSSGTAAFARASSPESTPEEPSCFLEPAAPFHTQFAVSPGRIRRLTPMPAPNPRRSIRQPIARASVNGYE